MVLGRSGLFQSWMKLQLEMGELPLPQGLYIFILCFLDRKTGQDLGQGRGRLQIVSLLQLHVELV